MMKSTLLFGSLLVCRVVAGFGFLGIAAGSAFSQPAASVPPASAPAAVRSDSVLRAKDLQADVALLRRAYESLHPGLYRYNTPAQMDRELRALESEFRRDRTLAEAYIAFSVFAAKVKCGHTYPNFSNQTRQTNSALFRAGRVPFYFRWLNRRMIVTRSFAGDRLQPGTEVLAINGTPVARILDRLMTVARADGNNDAKRVASMEVQGAERYEAFDIYFPLFFPSSAPRITLQLRGPNGGRRTVIEVEPFTFEQRLESMKQAGAVLDEDAPAFELRFLEDGIAFLRMPTWALYNSKWNWKAFLTESFGELVRRGATDLVLDLRGNEGGLGVGDEIVAHLTSAEVTRPALVRRVRYRTVPDDLKPFLDTWDPSFFDWGSSAIDWSDSFYRLRRNAEDEHGSTIKPVLPTFTGRTWVLVGAANSSATFEFAQMVRENRLGKLVGQPTGGNQRGINGGAFFFLRLPHSNIEMDLPLIGQFPDGNRPDAGLQPDIMVVPTASDIARGRDVEMDAVRARTRPSMK